MTRDLATGLVCLATSLILLALTLGLPGPSLLVPIGPGFYPRIILGITALLSAVLVVQALLARRSEPRSHGGATTPVSAAQTDRIDDRRGQVAAGGSDARPNYGLVARSFAVFGVYVALLPLLGFRLATLAFVIALQWLLGRPRTTRAWLTAFVIGLVTAFGVFHLFQDYLSVLLPRGRWTGF
jgi:putative tricarboxylic transport membrane protein